MITHVSYTITCVLNALTLSIRFIYEGLLTATSRSIVEEDYQHNFEQYDNFFLIYI